jgi:hypothetical protein
MNPDRRILLANRLQSAISLQPEISDLRHLLLRAGGIELVAPPCHNPDIARLIDSGALHNGRIQLHAMQTSACHANVARIWGKNRWRLIGIGTGYALSEDGLWRQHSWGVRRSGILETTQVRSLYFGITLDGVEAERFSIANRG